MADEEVVLLRLSCTDVDGNHRLQAAIALCEATATTTELSDILIEHIHLNTGTLALPGSDRREARTGYLSRWGIRQVAARIAWLNAGHPGEEIGRIPVIYTGNVGAASGGVSAAKLMERSLKIAGLAGQPGIKPGSIGAAFGRRVWKQTGDLRLVARALGNRTLDAAAAEIGVNIDDLPADAEALLRAAVLDDGHGEINALRGAAHPGKGQPALARKVPDTPKPVKARAIRLETGGQ